MKKGNYENGDEKVIHHAMSDAVSSSPVLVWEGADYHDHDSDWEKKVKPSEVTTPRKDGANETTMANRCERDEVCSNSVLCHEQHQLECVDGGGLVKVKP